MSSKYIAIVFSRGQNNIKNINFNRLVRETRGRRSLVSVGEIQVMLGFCLQKTRDSETLNPDVVAEFVEKGFEIKVQRKWDSRFLENQSFSLEQSNGQAGYEYTLMRCYQLQKIER